MKGLLALAVALSMTVGISQTGYAKKHHRNPASETATTGKDKTLAQRLGGWKAISAVIEDFVDNRVAKDTRINKFFAHSDLKSLKMKLKLQVCEAAGGFENDNTKKPCKYTGVYKDMKTAHAGMGVQEADFNAMVEDLTKSLNKFKVAAKDQEALLGVLGSMKKDIVETKAASAQ